METIPETNTPMELSEEKLEKGLPLVSRLNVEAQHQEVQVHLELSEANLLVSSRPVAGPSQPSVGSSRDDDHQPDLQRDSEENGEDDSKEAGLDSNANEIEGIASVPAPQDEEVGEENLDVDDIDQTSSESQCSDGSVLSEGRDMVPMMRRRNITPQDDLDEIKRMILAAERPTNYQRNRNKALFAEDEAVQMAARLYDNRSSFMDLAQIPVEEKKQYVARRTVRTFDNSRRKAPPLPTPSPPVKIRNPPIPAIEPEKLLGKLLMVSKPRYDVKPSRASSADSTRSSTSIKLGILKKGPYYQEPFEAAHLPFRLPVPVKRPIDNSFLPYHNVSPPKQKELVEDLMSKKPSEHPKPPPSPPKLTTKVLELDCDVDTLHEEHTVFVEAAKPVTPRCFEELDHNPHIVPSNLCFVRYFSKQQHKQPMPVIPVENSPDVPLLVLPSLKATPSGNKYTVLAGLDSLSKMKSARTKFRETYYKLFSKNHSRSLALLIRKPKETKTRKEPVLPKDPPYLHPQPPPALAIAGNRIS